LAGIVCLDFQNLLPWTLILMIKITYKDGMADLF